MRVGSSSLCFAVHSFAPHCVLSDNCLKQKEDSAAGAVAQQALAVALALTALSRAALDWLRIRPYVLCRHMLQAYTVRARMAAPASPELPNATTSQRWMRCLSTRNCPRMRLHRFRCASSPCARPCLPPASRDGRRQQRRDRRGGCKLGGYRCRWRGGRRGFRVGFEAFSDMSVGWRLAHSCPHSSPARAWP